MKVHWTAAAIGDLVDVRLYIADNNPEAASETAEKILNAVELIVEYPQIGRTGRAHNTREVVVPGTSYILVYRSFKTKIQLLRVLHGRRLWPPKKRR